MKAIVQEGYGSPDTVLQLRDLDQPVVKAYEVLVRVRAASMHPDIWHVVHGRPYILRLMGSGLLRPRCPVPGTDVAGVVESVGGSVTRFRSGDEVFGETARINQWRNAGAFAEYVSVPEAALAPKPANVTFEQAAAVPTAGLILLLNVRLEQLKPGVDVLVNGAGGGVGSIAVQLAKARGATVTGVDSTAKLDLVRSLGSDHVIDYTDRDFTETGDQYDLVVDIPGGRPYSRLRRALKPGGRYVLIGHDHYGREGLRLWGTLPRFFRLMLLSLFVKQLPKPDFSTSDKQAQMAVLAELLESGKLTPVIDRTYPLAEVAEAMRRLAAGDNLGKIIITV